MGYSGLNLILSKNTIDSMYKKHGYDRQQVLSSILKDIEEQMPNAVLYSGANGLEVLAEKNSSGILQWEKKLESIL